MKRLRSWSFPSFNPWSLGRVIRSVSVPQRRCISFRNCWKCTCHVKWITNQSDSLILKVRNILACVQIVCRGRKAGTKSQTSPGDKSKLLRLGWRHKMLHLNLRQLLLNLKSPKADEIQKPVNISIPNQSFHALHRNFWTLCPLATFKSMPSSLRKETSWMKISSFSAHVNITFISSWKTDVKLA